MKEVWNNGSGQQVTVISTGPMTNIALFVTVHGELLPAVEEFVFMGGGIGLGNRSAVAEYNILCDREHSHIMNSNTGMMKISHSSCSTDCPQCPDEENYDPHQCHSHCDCHQRKTYPATTSRVGVFSRPSKSIDEPAPHTFHPDKLFCGFIQNNLWVQRWTSFARCINSRLCCPTRAFLYNSS
jgi:hypothetical protein